MTTYHELINDPPKAVEFGPNGFVLNDAAYAAVCEEAYITACESDSPNSRDFERLLNSVEEDLIDRLEQAVKNYAHQPD